jgi:hypothetical protein
VGGCEYEDGAVVGQLGDFACLLYRHELLELLSLRGFTRFARKFWGARPKCVLVPCIYQLGLDSHFQRA